MPTDNIATTLITHGRVLATLLREIETKQLQITADIYEKAEEATNRLLYELAGDLGFPAEESLVKILQKIKGCLGEFTKHDSDNASGYAKLMARVDELISVGQSPVTHGRGLRGEYTTTYARTVTNNNTVWEGFNLRYVDYLFHVLCLLPGEEAIKKQQLLHWCLPDGFGDDGYVNFNSMLTEFVENGIIEVVAPAITGRAHQRLRLKYRLQEMMRPKGQLYAGRFGGIYPIIETWNCLVLNVSEQILDSKTYDWIFRLNEVRAVHLGDWSDDPTRYIVVQDVDAMAKALMNHSDKLYFLSLQGVSGIVELPRGFYGLFNLSILNLRGCHNLESLPDGIQGLTLLNVLDVSECYLLNHIPKGIGELYRLVVLKGFIIPRNSERPSLSQALLSDLSKLAVLQKLYLRTRRWNFPTDSDLQILCELKCLTTLKVNWVGVSSCNNHAAFDDNSKFPNKVEKFEIEAASKYTAARILDLIARQNDTSLKKLYIRGGDLSKLVPNIKCKVLRLQYLPGLSLDCYQMMRTFPKLHRLEMSSDVISSLLRRSFKIATGSLDKAGNPPGPIAP